MREKTAWLFLAKKFASAAARNQHGPYCRSGLCFAIDELYCRMKITYATKVEMRNKLRWFFGGLSDYMYTTLDSKGSEQRSMVCMLAHEGALDGGASRGANEASIPRLQPVRAGEPR